MRQLFLAALAVALLAGAASANGGSTSTVLRGKYVEARTCDVWTGPCFANAELSMAGKNAVVGWMIDKGSVDGVSLDGLGVVAVIAATDTLGTKQSGKGKAVLIVDRRADGKQRDALVKFARRQAGDLVGDVVAVRAESISLDCCQCKDRGCYELKAGTATIATRCLDAHDKVCGNESAYYEPLTRGVRVEAAMTTEHAYRGRDIGARWSDANRRGAYVGTFEAR
jgi:hypothetical protein